MSVGDRQRGDDRHWVRRSILLLGSSLLILTLGFLLYQVLQHGRGNEGAATKVIAGGELNLSGATSEQAESGVRIVSVPKGRRAAAMAPDVSLTASDYSYVVVTLSGYRPTIKVLLLWSTSDAPSKIQGTPLAWTGRSELGLRVETVQSWQGLVTSVGIGVVGPVEDPITIHRVRLVPSSPGSWLGALWREWTTFEGFDGHSTNFVIGGSSQMSQLIRPVPAVAAWLGLALLLYALFVASGRWSWDARVTGSIVVLGWLLLDARWQLDLWRQLGITHERYAEKSWPEKRLAAEDGELFRFAMEVKRRIPEEPQTLFVLTQSPESADRYLALRSRYHLLPHNVCSYYSHPPPKEEMRPGSYLLVFHPRSDIIYDESSGRLFWDHDGRVPDVAAFPGGGLLVEPIFSAELGSLYRSP